MKISTSIKMLAAVASLSLAANAYAGDGSKDNPYTVAEANAKAPTLTANDTIWVKADLKGLGTDGASTENSTDVRADSAAVFTDGTENLTAYSYNILQGLAVSDLTNTKGLLFSMVYKDSSDASASEVMDGKHFSICDLENALRLSISHNYRGYHIQSNYILPAGMYAVSVRAGYSTKSGATMGYTYYSGDTLLVVGKNSAYVLIAKDGDYDITLTSRSSNTKAGTVSTAGGKNAGLNTVTTNNRYLYRFVADADGPRFERNSDNQKEVTLSAKDEIWLAISALATNFYGNYAFDDGDTKKLIKWTGMTYEELVATGISPAFANGKKAKAGVYTISGQKTGKATKGIYIMDGKKVVVR